MITIDMFCKRKFPEFEALRAIATDAGSEMFKKLKEKYMDGWGGWDDPIVLPFLKVKLLEHAEKDFTPENMIDVMNLAAMIRNLQI